MKERQSRYMYAPFKNEAYFKTFQKHVKKSNSNNQEHGRP